VTLSVESVASAGFTGWNDDRGVRVAGTLFAGDIWKAANAAGAACYADNLVTRPGTAEVRVFTSSRDWKVETPVRGDGSITLETYGFDAQSHDALGQLTGVGAVSECTSTAAADPAIRSGGGAGGPIPGRR
jgi:hypothetical protein